MTGFTVTIEDKAVLAELAALRQRIANMQPVLSDIGTDIVLRAKARFGTGIGADGAKWLPKKKPDGRPTLIGKSGNLRREISHNATASALTVSASMEYAAIQQFGGTIERAAYSKQVRHRNDAKGNLLRSKIMGGKGLVFAKNKHERVTTRWFEVPAHQIKIPPRPFMPIRLDGTLYPEEQREILAAIAAWVSGTAGT